MASPGPQPPWGEPEPEPVAGPVGAGRGATAAPIDVGNRAGGFDPVSMLAHGEATRDMPTAQHPGNPILLRGHLPTPIRTGSSLRT